MGSDGSDKISRGLSARVSAGGREVDAVVELAPAESPGGGGSRAARIAALRDAFERQAVRVEETVERAGGEVVERAWINRTLHVRLPPEALDAVADLDEVRLLDAPRKLEPES